jgi:hypothetical protein
MVRTVLARAIDCLVPRAVAEANFAAAAVHYRVPVAAAVVAVAVVA